jgi:OOP family OmpA-OmpF porin
MLEWQRIGIMLAALVVSIGALGQDAAAPAGRHLYVGGGLGEAHWRPGCPSSASAYDDANPTVRAFAGYQINRIFSGEVVFTNYGKATGTNAEVKGRGWEASGLAAWPVWHRMSVLGRLGIYRGVVKGGGQFANHTESNYGATYGIGAQADFTPNLGARLEWQRFPGVGGSTIIDNDVETITLSALWRFR